MMPPQEALPFHESLGPADHAAVRPTTGFKEEMETWSSMPVLKAHLLLTVLHDYDLDSVLSNEVQLTRNVIRVENCLITGESHLSHKDRQACCEA
jgi:hypothetical protein